MGQEGIIDFNNTDTFSDLALTTAPHGMLLKPQPVFRDTLCLVSRPCEAATLANTTAANICK